MANIAAPPTNQATFECNCFPGADESVHTWKSQQATLYVCKRTNRASSVRGALGRTPAAACATGRRNSRCAICSTRSSPLCTRCVLMHLCTVTHVSRPSSLALHRGYDVTAATTSAPCLRSSRRGCNDSHALPPRAPNCRRLVVRPESPGIEVVSNSVGPCHCQRHCYLVRGRRGGLWHHGVAMLCDVLCGTVACML